MICSRRQCNNDYDDDDYDDDDDDDGDDEDDDGDDDNVDGSNDNNDHMRKMKIFDLIFNATKHFFLF